MDRMELESIAALHDIYTSKHNHAISAEQSIQAICENIVKLETNNGQFVGTGIQLTTDGHIITANHVADILEDTGKVNMGHSKYSIQPRMRNTNYDIAVLKAGIQQQEPQSIRMKVNSGNASHLTPKQTVLITGQSSTDISDIAYASVLDGARSESQDTFWAISKHGKPGYSGGALIDLEGNLQGMILAGIEGHTKAIESIHMHKITEALQIYAEYIVQKTNY